MSYADKLAEISKKQDLLMIGDNGESVILPVRVPMAGEYVIINAINYVCNISAFDCFEMISIGATTSEVMSLDLNDEQYNFMIDLVAEKIQAHLWHIFGDGYTLLPMQGGIHRYKKGFYIKGFDNQVLGTVGIGGQNNTVFIGISGTGCDYADFGFENRLYDFLDNAPNAHITRIDLAHDDFDGSYSSFELANQKETEKAFMLPKARIRPAVVIHGEYKHNDPNNKGLTLNVGSRQNGKLARCYEKGKQLGDKDSFWFRSELEIHRKAVEIPFDCLIRPTEFFCGAYPYCWELIELAKKHKGDNMPQFADKMPAVKKNSEISLNKMISIIKHQFGKAFKALGEIYKSDNEPDYKAIFDKVVTSKNKDFYPKRLKSFAYIKAHQNEELSKSLINYYSANESNIPILPKNEEKISPKAVINRSIFSKAVNGELPPIPKSEIDEINEVMRYFGARI